jgi:hypothetical protein
VNAFKSRNLTNDRDGNPHVLNEAENQSFLGYRLGALIYLEKCGFSATAEETHGLTLVTCVFKGVQA